jgi:hypothetical protein
MQQMMTAMAEQRQSVEESLQEKIAQLGRQVQESQPSEVQSLENRSSPLQDSEIWKKIASLEERLGRCASTDPATLSRLSAVEDRAKVCPLLEAEVRACQERLAANSTVEADLRNRISSFEALVGERIAVAASGGQDVGARLLDLEMKLAQSPPRDVVKESRLADLEQQNSALSSTCGELRTAFETAIGELAREVSDQAIAKDMKFKVLETRIDGLQVAASDLATQLEADRHKASSMIQECAKDSTTLEKQMSVIDDRISQALATEDAPSLEKQTALIDDRISQALAKEDAPSLEKQLSLIDDRISEALAKQDAPSLEKQISLIDDRISQALAKEDAPSREKHISTIDERISQALASVEAPSLEKQLSPIDERISQALASAEAASLEKHMSAMDERISKALSSEPITSLQKDMVSLREQLESKLSERLETVEKNISVCVESLQSVLDDVPRQVATPDRNRPVQSNDEQAQDFASGTRGQPATATSVADIYAEEPRQEEETRKQQQVSEQSPTKSDVVPPNSNSNPKVEDTKTAIEEEQDAQTAPKALPVEQPHQIASSELRDGSSESAPETLKASAEQGKPMQPDPADKTQLRDQDVSKDGKEVVKAFSDAQEPGKQNPQEMKETYQRNLPEKPVKDEVAAEDTTCKENDSVEPRQMSKNETASPQLSVLENLDRTAMRIEDRVSGVDSRLLQAVEAIEANKAETEQKFHSMEARLHEIATNPTKLEYDDLASRLQAVENGSTAHQATAPPRETRKAEASLADALVSSPVTLKDAEKKTVAAAMVMMEQKLEGYVSTDAFNGLREHMQDGLENIGERIRSAHESQMQKTESMLTQLLESRRQRSRGGKRVKDPPQDSENDATQPNTSSIESSIAVIPEDA